MTEEEWLSDRWDYENQLNWIGPKRGLRAVHLFGFAVCNAVRERLDPRVADPLALIEKFADGLIPATELESCEKLAWRVVDHYLVHEKTEDPDEQSRLHALHIGVASAFLAVVEEGRALECIGGCVLSINHLGGLDDELIRPLFRDIFGNPFRPFALDPRWLTSDVLDLARAIYEGRAFERMPILADALMDAGCDSDDILNHCRGDGPHVRGCWVVDLLLGKE
jgi:hypothetical protein